MFPSHLLGWDLFLSCPTSRDVISLPELGTLKIWKNKE
jgi:hypothetical protein